jgi:hypothetical protein
MLTLAYTVRRPKIQRGFGSQGTCTIGNYSASILKIEIGVYFSLHIRCMTVTVSEVNAVCVTELTVLPRQGNNFTA